VQKRYIVIILFFKLLLQSIQFSDKIFGMDWVTADQKVRENLIMIMNRSLIPIEFSSVHILMNLDSFVKVRDIFVILP